MKNLVILYTVGIGLAASLSLFLIIRHQENQHISSVFEQLTIDRVASFVNELELNHEGLINLRGLFNASEKVTRSEFHAFTSPILKRHPTIQALEWIPRVLAKERVIFENSVRHLGFSQFCISEKIADEMQCAKQRAEYFPVYFLEPYRGNEKAFGFDLMSNSQRRQALEKARDTGNIVLTSRIKLVQEYGKQYGFLSFIPVYKGGFETLAQRRKNLQGFVLGVFRVGDILEKSIKNIQAEEVGIEITLLDVTIPSDQQLLHQYKTNGPLEKKYKYEQQLREVGGRVWTIFGIPSDKYVRQQRTYQAHILFLFGLLFTALAAFYIRSQRHKNEEVERLVKIRTEELNQTNILLKKAKNKAESGSRAKTDFLNTMSHELRTPLSAILGNLDYLLNVVEEEGTTVDHNEVIEVLQETNSAGDHLRILIDDVLDFSRIEAGKVNIEPVKISARQVVQTVIKNVLHLSDKKGLSLQLNHSQDIFLWADEIRLKQILINLIANAIKFTERGTITVDWESQHDQCLFSVIDTGCGISEHDLQSIFERFTQVDSSSTRLLGGTGLGLTITKNLVELHGGEVSVASKIGQGSTFFFSIPIYDRG